jgi:hypothetical protein
VPQPGVLGTGNPGSRTLTRSAGSAASARAYALRRRTRLRPPPTEKPSTGWTGRNAAPAGIAWKPALTTRWSCAAGSIRCGISLTRWRLTGRTTRSGEGGGVTLSGGEPMASFDFVEAFLERKGKLHVCLETSGYAPADQFERIAPMVDLFLYDWKATTMEKHRQLCGVDNELIGSNLRLLCGIGANVLLRPAPGPRGERRGGTPESRRRAAAGASADTRRADHAVPCAGIGKRKPLRPGRADDGASKHRKRADGIVAEKARILRGHECFCLI